MSQVAEPGVQPDNTAPAWASRLVAAGALLATLLALDGLRVITDTPLLAQWIRIETQYFLALVGVLLPLAFVHHPRRRWLDIPLAVATFAICAWLFVTAERGLDEAWEFAAPETETWLALGLWLLVLEALRRAAGWALFVIAGLFSVLPLVADQLPDAISGLASSWQETAAYHVFSSESLFGLPFRAFANLVIGFVIFGVALQFTGGGRFFLNIAFALLGRVRGGAAKVAVVSSALMGSMSGSVVTNVLTTGQMTIPAMRRAGMRGEVAGGIEACASTGGVLLPPIMGSTAFVMATILEVPYFEVAAAAALPALLYFVGLFLQIDAYAARVDLKGADPSDVPSLGETLREGWHYVGAFAVLVFLLIVLQREALAPYYATAALLVLNQLRPAQRMGLADAAEFARATGALLVELVVILAGVGLIVGALSVTGLSGTLVNDLLYLAGDSIGLLLVMGALTSFVLGIGMTVTAAYIFLAVILAPALTQANLNPMSVHLFILYWAMLSFITPPVALGAFAASSIAGSDPVRTGLQSMRLGSVIYFLPFVFVLDPSFVLAGTWVDIVRVFLEALLGTWLLVGALQGYLPMVGHAGSWLARIPYGVAGLTIALPGLEPLGLPWSNPFLFGFGLITATVLLMAHWFGRRYP